MKKLILALFIIFPYLLSAQPAPIKWKNIPIEDLKMTEYAIDPGVPAVILCDYGQMYFDINPNGQHLFLFVERHVRIKILNEEGVKQAHIKIPFHDIRCEKFQKENNIVINARAYNLSKKGEIESIKLKRKNITLRDSTDCYSIAEFTIPGVKVGSVIEYKYKIPTLEMIYPKSWFFQTNIPIIHSEFRMRTPNDFQYLISPVNIPAFDVNEQDYYTKNLSIDVLKYYRNRYGSLYSVKEKAWVDMSGKSFRLVKKDIPAFACEQFLDEPEDQKQRINIHLVRIIKNTYNEYWNQLTYSLMITTDDYYDTKTPEQRRMIVYPPAYYIYELPDWAGFSKEMLKSSRFGLPLTMYWNHKYMLDSIVKGIDTQQEKLIAIYDYVRKNIKWNGEYDVYANRVFSPLMGKLFTKITNKVVNEKSLRRPFENKSGTSSEINFILIYLLNKVGVESNPVLVSTRENGKIDKNFPDAGQFNHVIAHVNIDGEALYLDATDSLRPFNLLKENTIGIEGFLVRKQDPAWVTIINKEISSTKEMLNFDIDENGLVKGQFKRMLSGYDALLFRQKKAITIENIVQNEFEGYKLDNFEVSNDQGIADKLIIQTDVKKEENANVIYIRPSLSCKYTAEQFAEFNRTCPIELDYPFEKEYELNLKIPKGYKVEYPQNIHIETYGKNAEFTYTTSQQGNDLQVRIKLSLKMYRFPAHEYYNLAEFFSQTNDKLEEEIVIKKKE